MFLCRILCTPLIVLSQENTSKKGKSLFMVLLRQVTFPFRVYVCSIFFLGDLILVYFIS